MTRRRMPRRGPGGRFLGRNAQRVKEAARPAGHPSPPTPPYERTQGNATRRKVDAQRDIGAVTPSGAPRPRCEECGEELTYAWMHSGRASYHVGRCMRCNPEPPVLVRE